MSRYCDYLETRIAKLEASLQTLLKYFGGPQGVSMQELGRDAYVSLQTQVRIGDLIDAREALEK
jgi:hypothetical protein